MTDLDAITRAAVECFSERGYSGTGIRDIAAAAGISSGTLYLHAENKLAILEAVMDVGLQPLLAIEGTLSGQGWSAPAELEHLVRMHVAHQALNPHTARVVDDELKFMAAPARNRVVAKRDQYERAWAAVLARGLETGEFVIEDPRVARLALLEMCNGVARWYRPRPHGTVLHIQDLFAQLAMRLVGYRGPLRGRQDVERIVVLPCEPVASSAS